VCGSATGIVCGSAAVCDRQCMRRCAALCGSAAMCGIARGSVCMFVFNNDVMLNLS
jgi:hypothetical protein